MISKKPTVLEVSSQEAIWNVSGQEFSKVEKSIIRQEKYKLTSLETIF